jgi:regulatory protein
LPEERGAAKVANGKIGAELIEEWASGYLGRYASSAENLRRVLRRRLRRRAGEDAQNVREAAPLIDALIERYSRAGLLDDAAYAGARALSLRRRGESAAHIRARLIEKGVDNTLATAALASLSSEGGDPELAAACAFARRRRLGPYRPGAADRSRDLAAFARAGFGRQIAETVLACADVPTVEALARDSAPPRC